MNMCFLVKKMEAFYKQVSFHLFPVAKVLRYRKFQVRESCSGGADAKVAVELQWGSRCKKISVLFMNMGGS